LREKGKPSKRRKEVFLMERMTVLAQSIMEAWAQDVREDRSLEDWVKTPQFAFWLRVMEEGKNQSSSR
jgi:hypothetical protein